MAESRTFLNVNTETWSRLQDLGRRQHGTVFEPADDSTGKATTRTPFGSLVLAYARDEGADAVTYEIVNKPLLVASPLVWAGIEQALEDCRKDKP
jgi:hypothetical protein